MNGSFAASSTYLAGDVHIVGSAVTSGLTETQGWAEYGPTTVTGSMQIAALPGTPAPVFSSNGGGSFWVDASPQNQTAFNVMEGNLAFGDATNGDTYLMTAIGVNLTIDANQAGGFYSFGGGTNIQVLNASQVINYANSSGPVNIVAQIPGLPAVTVPVAVGQHYVASLCVLLLGCVVKIPVVSITWGAGTHFSILGQTLSGGSGMTASMPDSRLSISVPPGVGPNISMVADQGSPRLTVNAGATYPALLSTYGRVTVSRGESLNASVVVNGTFSAQATADNGGTFYNAGGLVVQGHLDSAGEQLFKHHLELGPQIEIQTAPGGAVETLGPTTIDSDVTILGSTNASGNLTIAGEFVQNSTLIHIGGNLSLNGTMVASGSVGTSGTTAFAGLISSSGAISLPHSFMDGTFLLTDGSFVGVGSTLLQGTSVGRGWTWVNSTTYSVVGSAWLNGTVDVNRSIVVRGNAELQTAPGGALHLNATVLMGSGGGAGSPWTSRVLGSVMVRGTSFANGTSSFNGTTVSFPSGLVVLGSVQAQGNVSVDGVTAFSGAVTSSGTAHFPGMSLTGTFSLSSAGGVVNGTGTSSVAGNVSLSGRLTVDHGVFAENGTSVILGTLGMTGTVLVTGDSTLATEAGTSLSLVGNINLAGAAHIVGNVNTTGNVTIAGSASLSAAQVVISGSLSAQGSVYSRGWIELTGTADFQGPVLTLGRTQLPGLDVAGNYTLRWGEFRLNGAIDLTGFTVSLGTITANAQGYFVHGESRIVGHTVATGSAAVWGSSLTVGYIDLGDGATLGGFMEVNNGSMSAGGLTLTGTIVLPNDTATFPQGANISGAVFQTGLLTSQGGAVAFYGESIVNGTVVSSGSPSLRGPIIASVFGGLFALTLGPEFLSFLVGLLLAVGVAGIELLRTGWKYRRPFTPEQRLSVRRMRAEPLLATALFSLGALTGAVGGYSQGAYLSVPAHASSASTVSLLYALASSLLLVGFLLWLHHRFRYSRARRPHLGARGAVPSRALPPMGPGTSSAPPVVPWAGEGSGGVAPPPPSGGPEEAQGTR